MLFTPKVLGAISEGFLVNDVKDLGTEKNLILLGSNVSIVLCHPAFAMTGALAWQVTKLNKKLFFWFLGEIARGFCPGSLPWCGVVCRACSLFLLIFIFPD